MEGSFGERRRQEFMDAWRDAVLTKRHEEHWPRPIKLWPPGTDKRWPRCYTLTTLEPDEALGTRDRTVMLGDFATLRDVVEKNALDIYEGTYLLAVIEEVLPNHNYGGFSDRDAYWFAWRGDRKTGRYVSIETPKMFANVSGFGVG